MRRKIPISGGKTHTWVSEEDYEYAMQWKWCGSDDSYARRHGRPDEIEGRASPNGAIWLHRVILERKLGHPIPRGMIPDHIDRNKLNNTRENLRLVTRRENTLNQARYDQCKHAKNFRRYGMRYPQLT